MSDEQDDVVDDMDALASSKEEVKEEFEDDALPYSDTTVNTPTPTVQMRISRTGEFRLSRREQWLRSLNRAIAEHPESPTNYVLRGELALEMKAYDQAVSDFKKALELASLELEESDWGIVAQVMQDRAHSGLAEAKRKTTKRRV